MPGVLDTSQEVDGKKVLRSHSFSGNEKNSFFLNLGGKDFADISGVSGLDSAADGRAFAFFDYDHDGREDLVLTNTNNPQLQLFHNEVKTSGESIAVSLVGGNTASAPSGEWSNRDGIGAHLLVGAGELKSRREFRAGDGFAAQNSKTMTIGIGQEKTASVTVLWPSGKVTKVPAVSSREQITIFENPKEGAAKVTPRHQVEIPEEGLAELGDGTLNFDFEKDLNVVVTVATWCPVCRAEIPHLARLAEDAGGNVGFYGVPIDPSDDEAAVREFLAMEKPPYQIPVSMNAQRRTEVRNLMRRTFGSEPLPVTFLVNRQGRVIRAMKGTPTISGLRMLIDEMK